MAGLPCSASCCWSPSKPRLACRSSCPADRCTRTTRRAQRGLVRRHCSLEFCHVHWLWIGKACTSNRSITCAVFQRRAELALASRLRRHWTIHPSSIGHCNHCHTCTAPPVAMFSTYPCKQRCSVEAFLLNSWLTPLEQQLLRRPGIDEVSDASCVPSAPPWIPLHASATCNRPCSFTVPCTAWPAALPCMAWQLQHLHLAEMQGHCMTTIPIQFETVCRASISNTTTNAMRRTTSGGALARVSAYRRPVSGLTEKTAMGGMLTVAGVAMAALLFVSELVQYLRGRVVHEMNVFTERKDELHVHLDVSMLSMPCHLLVVGATEGTGEGLHHAESELERSLLDDDGRHIGPYVRTAVHPHAGGCRLRGELKVGRIAGALRFLVQENAMLAFRNAGKNGLHQNTSHVIEKLRFGPSYKGMVNPMEGLKQVEVERNGSWTYFLKLVPTTYQSRWKTKETNQYSMTEFFNQAIEGHSQAPHLTISYEMSPYSIKMKEENIGFGHFLVRICAVVGGTYAFTRMLDRWLYLLTSHPHAHTLPSGKIQALHA